MAVPLLAKELSKQYIELLEQRQDGRIHLSRLEQERFGWTHGEAAARLATQWNLPEEFGRLIESHASLELLRADGGASPGQYAVTLSSLLPASSDEIWHDCAAFEAAYNARRPSEGPSIPELLEKIDGDFAEFAPVLKLAAPAKSLVDRYQEVTQVAS
jgi:hypothetical protein